MICDWLAARGQDDARFRDSRRNAALWRDEVLDERLAPFAASYLRAVKARTQYRGDVLNRKATFAIGSVGCTVSSILSVNRCTRTETGRGHKCQMDRPCWGQPQGTVEARRCPSRKRTGRGSIIP
jgi:hypothetical protein